MTVEELFKKARENKLKAQNKAKTDFKEWFKSYYKDCEEDIKQDRLSSLHVFPDDYKAIDLLIDNLLDSITSEDKFNNIYFVELAKKVFTVENTDLKDFAY